VAGALEAFTHGAAGCFVGVAAEAEFGEPSIAKKYAVVVKIHYPGPRDRGRCAGSLIFVAWICHKLRRFRHRIPDERKRPKHFRLQPTFPAGVSFLPVSFLRTAAVRTAPSLPRL
jgi:hypothetical protein